MENLLQFVLPGVGLYLLIDGVWRLGSSFRRKQTPGNNHDPALDLSDGKPSSRFAWWRRINVGGLFWLALGIATLWFSTHRILTVVGAFWALIGAISAFTTFRKGKRPPAAIPSVKVAPGATASARDGLRTRRLGALVSIFFGIAILWLSGLRLGRAPAVDADSTAAGSPLAGTVSDVVARTFRSGQHIGLVVGAVSGEDEVLLAFGNERLGGSHPPDADTVFEIGSITKAFTGILLARQIESGKLALDDRIAERLPEGWTLSDAARGVTLRHLTTHTSGFPRLPENLLGISGIGRSLFGGDPYRTYSRDEFRRAVAEVELEFEPGSDDEYSNFAVGLLGSILAAKDGTTYEALLKRELLDPLGMDRTTITASDRHPAPGYRGTLKIGPAMLALGASPWEIPDHLAGAGAIRSTGRDMLRFLKANMGLVPSPLDGAIQRSHEELFKESDLEAMGMNWIRSLDGSARQTILWHNGGTGGYRSYLGFTEDREHGIVILSNTSNSVDGLGIVILRELARGAGESKAESP